MTRKNDNVNMIKVINNEEICKSDVHEIPEDALVPYKNYPFRLYDGECLEELIESIRENGIQTPLIVRRVNESFEVLSGHNRWNAAWFLGLKTVPAIIKTGLTEEEAYTYVIESNMIQRSFEELFPSERAAVLAARYKRKVHWYICDAIVREIAQLEGKEITTTVEYLNGRKNRREVLGMELGLSGASVERYLRVNKLIPELLLRLDMGALHMRSAVALSFCTEKEQKIVYELEKEKKIKLNPKTAQLIKNKSGELLAEAIVGMVEKDKKRRKK